MVHTHADIKVDGHLTYSTETGASTLPALCRSLGRRVVYPEVE